MRRQLVAVAVVWAGSVGSLACEDTPATPNDAAAGDVTSDTKPPPVDAGADTTSSDAAAEADVAPPTIIDVADTPCTNLSADAGVVLVKGPGAPRFVDLGVVSTTQRFAGSEAQDIGFDSNGANVSKQFAPAFIDLIVSSTEGDAIAVGSLNSGAVGFSRFDAVGNVVLATQTIQATTPPADPALAIASKAGASLVVWRQGTNLRGLEYAQSAGAPVDFGANTFGAALDVAAGYDGSSYAVAWTADSGDGTWRLRFSVWGSTTTSNVAYYQKAVPMHVASLVPAAGGGGWTALVNSELPSQAVLLVPMDANGNLTGPIRRYLGAQYAWRLASSSTGYALVARRATDEPEWRSLTPSGDGNSAWICLDASLGNQIGGCGVDADGINWAAVYSTASGGASFVRLNPSGNPL